jgi:hypothetical protein
LVLGEQFTKTVFAGLAAAPNSPIQLFDFVYWIWGTNDRVSPEVSLGPRAVGWREIDVENWIQHLQQKAQWGSGNPYDTILAWRHTGILRM